MIKNQYTKYITNNVRYRQECNEEPIQSYTLIYNNKDGVKTVY